MCWNKLNSQILKKNFSKSLALEKLHRQRISKEELTIALVEAELA